MGRTNNSRLNLAVYVEEDTHIYKKAEAMSEELKMFYQHMPSKTMNEFCFFLRDLLYITQQYKGYEELKKEIFYMVLPNS
jgi:hypothetical protein